jgi:uncharacterized OsmC-like protein
MKKKNLLVSNEVINAHLERIKKIKEIVDTKDTKGNKDADQFYIKKFAVETEQIDNLYIKNKIGEFQLECDEREELGGSNKAPNPMQMLLSSLASCSLLTAAVLFSLMQIKVKKLKLKLSATYNLRVFADPGTNDRPGFENFHFKWYIDTKEPRSKLENALIKAEQICPVRGSLEKENSFSKEIIIKNQVD